MPGGAVRVPALTAGSEPAGGHRSGSDGGLCAITFWHRGGPGQCPVGSGGDRSESSAAGSLGSHEPVPGEPVPSTRGPPDQPDTGNRWAPALVAIGHRVRFFVALSAGRIGDAEAHAAEMECLNRPEPSWRSAWLWCMGRLAFARGRYEEARGCFLEGRHAAGLAAVGAYERQLASDIETCQRRLAGEKGSWVPPFYVPRGAAPNPRPQGQRRSVRAR